MGDEEETPDSLKGGVQVEGQAKSAWRETGTWGELLGDLCGYPVMATHPLYVGPVLNAWMEYQADRFYTCVPAGRCGMRLIYGNPAWVRATGGGSKWSLSQDSEEHLWSETGRSYLVLAFD